MSNIDDIKRLLRDANNIRTEKDPGDNDAERVGKMFVDIIEYLSTHSGSGSGEGGDSGDTPTPTPGGNTFNNGIVVTAGGASINGPTNITGTLNVNGNITGKVITGDQINSNGTITAKGDIIGHGGLEVENDIRTNTGSIYAPNGDISGNRGIFDYLTVNKSAHFFELVLDQLRANKGAILITNGQCKVDDVETLTNRYRVYYRAQDDATENPKAIHQSFIIGDLAICQTFGDGVKVGTNTNITTTYYWRAVSAVSTNPVQRSDGKLYHWIELSNVADRCDGSSAPKIGDEIVQLGFNNDWRVEFDSSLSRLEGDDLMSRQSAIIISAYQTKDAGVVPPSLAFYQGINSFVLGNDQRGTYIDAKGGFFKGTLSSETIIQDGGSLDVNTETYQLIPSNNPIIKGTPSVTFSVFKSTGGSGNLLTQTDLVNEHLQCKAYNGTTQIGSEPINPLNGIFTVSGLASLSGNLTVDLIDSTEIDPDKKKTRFTTSFVDLGTVTNGVNGQYTQFVFKNAASRPTSTPRNNEAFTEGDNGWVSSPSDPPTGQVTWVTLRIVTPQADDTFRYTSWSAILQFSSISGLPGASHQQAFKVQSKTATPPTTPTSDSNYPPTGGWVSSVPTSVAEGNVIYFTERVVTPTGENTYDYGAWSTPMIYNGIEGAPGESWTLAAIAEAFEVRITNEGKVKLEDVVGVLYTHLEYALIHTVGDAATVVEDTSGYKMKIESDNTSGEHIFTKTNFAVTWSNFLAASNVNMNTNYHNYYWLYNESLKDSAYKSYMPTNLKVSIIKLNETDEGETIASRVVPLIFSPSGYFGALQDGLISIYQGLSGNTDANWQTGFSQIKQTWDNISLSVSNIETVQSGGTFVTDINNQYAYYRTNLTGVPSAPTGDVTVTTIANNAWTTYPKPAVTSTFIYGYYSHRSRANSDASWTNWSTPKLYAYRDPNTHQTVDVTLVNTAELNIKADEIRQTVEQSVSNGYYSKSDIDQKADTISLSVTQKTAGNKNYLLSPSFDDAGLLDVNWEKIHPTITPEGIMHSQWRYAYNTTAPSLSISLTNNGTTQTYTSSSNRCAVLSSYIGIPLESSNNVKSEVIQRVTLEYNKYYTFSIWAKRSIYAQAACQIGFGIYLANLRTLTARAYTSNGYTTDSSVTATTGSNYVTFTITDDDWHLLVLEFAVSAAVTNAQAWIGVNGNNTSYEEVYVSRPFLSQGQGITGTATALSCAQHRIYGLKYSTTSYMTNIFDSSEVVSTLTDTVVNKWGHVITDDDRGVMKWDSTEQKVTNDDLSEYLINKLYGIDVYPNAVQLSGTVASLAVSGNTDYRWIGSFRLHQEFSAELANQLKDETFTFSTYIKRNSSWSNKAHRGSDELLSLYPGLWGANLNLDTIEAGVDGNIRIGDLDKINCIQRFYIPLDDFDWHRIWWTFKLNTNTDDTINALTNGFALGFWTNVNTYSIGEDWLFSRPKLEIGETPSMWTDSNDDIKSGLSRTGIDISAGKIVLDAENTEITGDLDLRGTFTSDNTTTMNKVVIDEAIGGISLYGPSHVDDYDHTLPTPEAVQRKIASIEFETDSDSLARVGVLRINGIGTNDTVVVDGEGYIEMKDDYRRLLFSLTGVGLYIRNNVNQEYGDVNTYWKDWETLLS